MKHQNIRQIGSTFGISILLLVGLFHLLSCAPETVLAAPIDLFVTSNGSGTDCSQANPCDLATALSQSLDGDTIYAAQGTYTGSGDAVIELTKKVNILGGWDGTTIAPLVRDPDDFQTVLDGENTRRVVYIYGHITPILDGFTVTQGNASNTAIDPGLGGGIYSNLADPIITHNVISLNIAYDSEWGSGGGIYISNSNGVPEPAVISNNLISNNAASSSSRGSGGGLYVSLSKFIEIKDNTFIGNTAGSDFNGLGGGMGLFESSAVVTGNQIEDNLASPGEYGYGGGFYAQNGDIYFDSNVITNNQAVSGNVTFMIESIITATNNIIAQNNGGGIYIEGSAGLPIITKLANNTISQNGDYGICAGCSGPGYATLNMANNIITGHKTGLFVYPESVTSEVTATHTLYYENDVNIEGETITSEYEITGNHSLFLNPSLGNFHLNPNSPAIDTGTPLSWVKSDIDGDTRPYPSGGQYDIGADEAIWLPVYLPVVMLSNP